MPESQDASCDGPPGRSELHQELDQIDLCPITLDDIKVDPDRAQTDDRSVHTVCQNCLAPEEWSVHNVPPATPATRRARITECCEL